MPLTPIILTEFHQMCIEIQILQCSPAHKGLSVQYFHNDLSRAILVSIITSISQIPIMVPLSVYVSELLPVLQ